MKVTLVGMTLPLIAPTDEDAQAVRQERGHSATLSPEEFIVYMARVSSPKNQGNVTTAPRLIKYLIDHGHWSPFDMVDLIFEIETSRAIAAQILRHWSFRFQEFSQRYAKADLGAEVYKERMVGKTFGNMLEEEGERERLKEWWESAQHEVIAFTRDTYQQALDFGIPKELARMVLPLATTTRLYMKGSVRSWLFYLKQRLAKEAQEEHREVAVEVQRLFAELFPVITRVFFHGATDAETR